MIHFIFTDKVVGVVEILAQVLLSGIGGRQLFVDDAARLVESGQVGRDVEHPADVERRQRVPVGCVPHVANKEERQYLRGRMRIQIAVRAVVVRGNRESTGAFC